MKFPVGLRRFLFAVAASGALLAGCGGGSVVGQLQPGRLVAFGDSFSDIGQAGGRYSVSDGAVDTWLEEVAARYGLPLTAQSAGGQGYGQGNVRITAKPDAGGSSTSRTVKEQIDAFLTASTVRGDDLIFVGGGFGDVIYQTVNTASQDTRVTNIKQAATDQAAQVRRLVAAGANQIVLTGIYDLGKTPWAVGLGQQDQISALVQNYNDTLKVALADLGKYVLYVDAANYFNFMFNQPGNYGFTDSTTVACTSTGSGTTGIGISASAHVSSYSCTTTTIATGLDYTVTLFADSVYTTPKAQRLFGDNTFDVIRGRF